MRTVFGPPAQWSRLCLTEFSKQEARNVGARISESRCSMYTHENVVVFLCSVFYFRQICGKMEEKGWGTTEVAKTLLKSLAAVGVDDGPAPVVTSTCGVIEFFHKELE